MMDSPLQEEEENANGHLNIGRVLSESHIPDRSEGHPRPDSSPPLASSSGVRPETETLVQRDFRQHTAGAYSADAWKNTPAGQPAGSGPLAGLPAPLRQTSAHSTMHNVMMSPGPSAGDPKRVTDIKVEDCEGHLRPDSSPPLASSSGVRPETGTLIQRDLRQHTAGAYSADAWKNTPAGQPGGSGPLAGLPAPLQQTSAHSTMHNVMTSPGPSAGDPKRVTDIKVEDQEGHPRPDSSPPLAFSSGVRPETETLVQRDFRQHTARAYSADAWKNTPAGQHAGSGPLAGLPAPLQQTSAHSTMHDVMKSPGPSAGDPKRVTDIKVEDCEGHLRPDSSPPLASSSGVRPETGTLIQRDLRHHTAGAYSADAWKNTPAGQPAGSEPLTGLPAPLQQTSAHSSMHNVMKSPGTSAGDPKGVKIQDIKDGDHKGNNANKEDDDNHLDDDYVFWDASDGSDMGNYSRTYKADEQWQVPSETAPGAETVATLKVLAILRKGIILGPQDKLFLVIDGTTKIPMDIVWYEGVGSMLSCSFSVWKEKGRYLAYTYCLERHGKETCEDARTKGWFSFAKCFAFRRPFRSIVDTDTVLYQFDDICMGSSKWRGKSTKIDEVRPNFVNAVMLHLMNCTNADFPDLQHTIECFQHSVKTRVICSSNREDEVIFTNLDVKVLTKALQEALLMQEPDSPIQKVLVAAVIAKRLGLQLDHNTVQHISKMVKTSGNIQGTLTGLDDSVRCCIASSLHHVVNMAMRQKSPKEVLWLTALYYAVCPPEHKQTLVTSGLYKGQVQSDLVEIVDTYSMKTGNQRAFASAVLEMFSPTNGDLRVLSKLNLSSKDLLEQLSTWQMDHAFHTLHEVIKKIASVIKPWVESSLQSRASFDMVKKDILSCLELTMNIFKKATGQWTYIENVYSVLHLLNSFNGCLNCIEGDKRLQKLSKDTCSAIIPCMTSCIKKVLLQRTQMDWTKLYEIQCDIWQDDWEKNLKKLFTDWLQKETEVKLVELFAKTPHCPHAMNECLLRQVTKAISKLYGKDDKNRYIHSRNQQALGSGSLMEIVSTCQRYGILMSLIIENISEDRRWHPSDYLHVLYNVKITELFKTLALRQNEEANYREPLSLKAKEFIQDTHTFLERLPEYIISKSISCQQMSYIIDRKKQPNTYTMVMGQNLKSYSEALQEAEKDFKSFREMQCNMRALYNICQGSPVDIQPLKSTMQFDLSTEKHSLKNMMEKLSPTSDSEESAQLINIQVFEKIGILSNSTYFKHIWRKIAKDVKLSEFEEVSLIPLNQVYRMIYKPAIEEFKNSHEMLMNLLMTLEDLENKMGTFLKKDAHKKELQHMNRFFSEDSTPGWVENTCEHIKRYQELHSAVENAKVVNDLKDSLGLQGDFLSIGNLQVMSHTCLRDLTLEMHKAGEIVKKFPPYVISFLKELSKCVENGFISWIKEIIKDTGELSAFVELASISAGENALDIDKVCYFRDAISAAAPLIYGLTEKSGFTEFRDAVREVQSELLNDKKLEEKLRDSCKNRDWLEIAYETHGSVERSSLRQATDINESGIYTIRRPSGKTMVTLENCIALKCKEVSSDGNSKYRNYSLTELKELQNKLMLITVTHDNREDGITNYVEVLEHIINVGTSFLELCDAGHVLFKDWEMTAYCKRERETKIWVNFGITNVKIKGQRPLLKELKGLCDSMQCCLSEWLKYVETKRNKYYSLNCFTAKQLMNLCCSMAEVQHKHEISASLLNMLSVMKEDITDEDVKDALNDALQTPVEDSGTQGSALLKKFLYIYPDHLEYFIGFGLPEKVGKAGIMYCEQQAHEGGRSSEDIDEYRDFVMEHIDEHQDDDDWVREWSEKYEKAKDDVLGSQMKFKGGHSSDQMSSFAMTQDEISTMFENLNHTDDKIVMLWKTYHNKLSGLVSDKFVDLDVLGETIQHIANSSTAVVQRKLPFGLEAGKPNLISCKYVEMAPLCLSVYKDEEQPLPSYDEILICTPETTAEEVELILRRALQSGNIHEKIYSLLNADKLNHEVSRKLESTYYKLSKTQDSAATENYRLIICCDSKASHSYVATAFDNFKRTLSENPRRNQEIKLYLKAQHKLPSGAEKGFGKLHRFQLFPQRTKLVFSEHAGMGKSLYVKSLVNAMKELKEEDFTHETIRLTESQLRPEHIIQKFQIYEDKPTDTVPRIFHFDVPPVVSKGLYSFLLQLFVLRCFQSPDGSMWRCNNSHVYLVEYTRRTSRECDRHNSEIPTKMEEAFLEMFPNVKCLSPEETQKYLSEGGSSDEEYQLMDQAEFSSEAFQRTYQYFKRYEQNQLENFSFERFSCEDTPKEWLQCLMRYCDNRTPSWGELRNFTHFLNMQLKKCEQSIFCSDILSQDLTGFKKFVVKFMITMSKDFSMRSLMISDESTEKEMNTDEDVDLQDFQLRRRWEQQAHPYIMFNADNNSMTFLGFHIHNLNAIDSRTGEIVEQKVIDRVLFHQLRTQRVPFNIEFEILPRKEQLDIISRVLGVINVTDPDDTYQLTLDNVMKILAIHLRFESDIPVIIMGETGCGKTRLVQFMCDLLRSGKEGKNMIVVRVHGGTTSETIYKKVKEAVEISKRNEALAMDTVLFFDEANTTEAVNAIKEVICDKSVNGEPIDARRLKIIAACNPYRKHSQEAIEQLEKAGLGYRVKSENTEEKLGQIPMRQLVYRVQPLPPSLSPLVWDFGKLNEKTQELYIQQMVKTFFQKEKLPKEHESLFTKVISASQMHMAGLTDECRMVSLRDIERCMKTVMWFYQQKVTLFPEMDKHSNSTNIGVHELVRSLILAIGVCYMASLENRDAYLEKVAGELLLTSEAISTEIESCKKVFIDHVDCPGSVAKNDALKENVFMMVVCMNLRIPLFLVGKPGSSKSLSKTIAAHAMQGKSSQSELFKGFKKAQLASFQCSPHSSPDGIISVFRQCTQFQREKNLDEYVSVVVLDEIGLAEDSPKMPLKTLHPLLEFGCIDDEQPEDFKKVAFIGISNWSLDPAKMNRGILVLRTSPEFEELENTALAICPHDEKHILPEIKILISSLTEFYQKVLCEQEQFGEFFGLRDFYSLVKLIVSYAIETNGRPSNEELTTAVQRNFGGFDSIDILKIFGDVFGQKTEKCDTISLLRENLTICTSGFTSRYLLLPTTNHAALQILKLQGIINEESTEVIFGSGFPHDEEYSQVCRTVNRVKTCMETGRAVILLNIQSLYESLYDALNQCYVKLGGSYYVDLGLGSHRVKCRVKDTVWRSAISSHPMRRKCRMNWRTG
ncbi:E3 ubiquitin-protein ligase RNF213-like isoform X1 [Alosa pseudoharengus]|uniref:E3 ubiquitin-protein ligase RNF213-like isoform X1 n=1 Tax=Alosa pseudoharengus TaxID=34774 RepID=UPI003F8B4E2C